jgi:chromate transporter
MAAGDDALPPPGAADPVSSAASRLWPLSRYFLLLGAVGFGGPAALVGYMHRDLVEQRGWVDEDTYRLSLGLAQIMPGPLAAQTAIAIGYFQAGVLGATVVGLAFVLPSFLMVLGLSALYVLFGGLWWMQALFYGIGAAVIAIIATAAYRLARSTNRRDALLWGVFAVMAIATAWFEAELAELVIGAGLIVLLARAWPGWPRATVFVAIGGLLALSVRLLEGWASTISSAEGGPLLQLLVFFTKAVAFVFGSGLAIVPFLQQGVVQHHGWLTEHQFLDAVAVAMITPGPVVITVAFIGYLVAGVLGATAAAVGIFLPVYILTIVPAPWFRRHREHPQLRAFVLGATAAATGAIAGATVVIATRSIIDLPTAVIGLVSLGLLWRLRLTEPVVVAGAGVAGLAAWLLVRGVT